MADLDDVELRPGRHQPDAVAFLELTLFNPDVDDDPAVGVVIGVEDEGFKRRFRVALRGGDVRDNPLQYRVDADAGLGGDAGGVHRRDADDVLDLLRDPVGVGGGEVDLVDDRDDLEVVVDREIGVGQRLGLNPLGGVDHQHRPFAGGQRPGNLVVEVDVAGGVDQVELVDFAVFGGILQVDGPGLDGDAPFPLDVHIVEQLVLHVPFGDGAGGFQNPVGEGGLAVVDVGDDAEVADMIHRKRHFSFLSFPKYARWAWP